MSVLWAYGSMPIFGEKSLFLRVDLFWERKPICELTPIFGEKILFLSAHHMWRKINMKNMEEKQCGMHVEKPSHVRVRVFQRNVMFRSQQNSINKCLRGLVEVGHWLIGQGDIVLV
jgi:hypothetical protein